MTEEEYKKEWESGLHRTEYNDCRFAADKIAYAREWIATKQPGIDIDNPKNIVDRINNYKIYDMNSLKPICADKISVLEEIGKWGLNDIVVFPYYKFRCTEFTEKMFYEIPDGKWIFKCNHGSGWNMKFEKKSGCNPRYLIEKLNEWLSLDYAFISGWEWHYHEINKGVIVQPCLADGPLMDWSFWCENGKVEYIQLTRKLGKNLEEYFAFTDSNGEKPDLYIGTEPMRFKLLEREKMVYEKMKPYISILAEKFKFVRVDLYYVNANIYFGELTFTPCSGKLSLKYI